MKTCVLANHLTGNVLAAKIVRTFRKLQVKSAWKTLENTTPSTSVAIGVALESIVFIRPNVCKASNTSVLSGEH